MAAGTIELRHIVDIDGQLIGVEPPIIDAESLMKRAGRAGDGRLVLVRGGRRTVLNGGDRISLREDEVLFFETHADPIRLEPSFPLAA